MIIGLFPGLGTVGGVQVAGRQTAAALGAIGHDRGWRCAFLSLNDARGEQETGVGGKHFHFTGFARAKFRFAMQALRLAREKPKVIWAAHPNLAPIAAMMRALSKDARTIVGAHGIEVWHPLPVARRRALRRANVVVAPSSDTVRRLTTVQGVLGNKICVLPWPLDPEFAEFTRCVEKLSRPEGFPSGQVVLSVGRWAANERYKGADLLIQAIGEFSQDFPQIHLVLVGSGDDLPRLKQLVQTFGVEKSVHFFPAVSRRELAACYASADIFALPSTGEGFGIAFLEAMAFGKPVIGVDAGGIPDVVENGREGLLIEPVADSVSSALRRLLSDQDLCKQMGKLGRQRVNIEFTYETFQQRLMSILNEVIYSKPHEN